MSDASKQRFIRLMTLVRSGNIGEADKAVTTALRTTPKDPNLLQLAAYIALEQNNTDKAKALYRRALAIIPRWFEATMNLAGLLARDKNTAEAIDLLQDLLKEHSARSEAWEALARLQQSCGALVQAANAWRYALALRPDNKEGLGQYCFTLRQICDWSREPVEPDAGLAPNIAAILFDRPETQLASAKEFCAKRFGAIPPLTPAQTYRHQRLRIGYLSSDFHAHATSWLIAELFSLHDRTRFEIYAYSYGVEDHSDIRARLRKQADHFIELNALTPDQCARRIREDEIDILIDLKGHTTGARLDILAFRPAPVQLHWLGFPATTGASFIDFFIADNVTAPPDASLHFSERVLRLPQCYQINDRQKTVAQPLSKADYGLPENAFVYASFNQTYKITPDIFRIWCDLLRETPNSVLWLYESNTFAPENLRQQAQEYGIEAARLIFAKPAPLPDHLARYHAVDLALDTFPVGGHTTTSDALWVGTPVVTLAGKTFVSRVAASLLTAAEIPECITTTPEDYKVLALALAKDEPRRSALREHLTSKRATLPLFDTPRFVKELEDLLLSQSR